MKSFLLAAALSLGSVLLAATAATAADPGWLQSPARLTALVEGQTHERTRADGGHEIEYQAADGRAAYLFDGCLWAGRWWIEENTVCYVYPALSGDQRHCFWLRETAQGVEFWSTEEPQAPEPLAITTSISQGNAQGLALDAQGRCREI